MNALEQEYDHGRKWPLSKIKEQGWQLSKVTKDERKEPHTYIVKGKWEEFKKEGRLIKFLKATETDTVRDDIVYLWKKGQFACSHVKTFNPIAILN
tara:strand:+ start:20000 stop:20287 length:288 start_codon:yes stop_codon:yes gene_type:complete